MTELRVTEAHLRKLATKQGVAAAAIQSATAAGVGVAAAVGAAHGRVATATATAIQAAEAARTWAGNQLAAESAGMRDRLLASVAAYANVDHRACNELGAQL